MSHVVNLPALGESVTEGTVTRWLKSVGDTVAIDEPLLEISTDKVDTEIPSPVAGVLLEISAEDDETVEVGGQLAVIGNADETVAATPASPAPAEPESTLVPAPRAQSAAQEQAPTAPDSAGTGASVKLPALGESVTEGTVTRWLKSVGDTVAIDEPLLEISTDKVDTEIPSPVAGTLLVIRVQEDDTVDVGAELAVIGSAAALAASAAPAESTVVSEQTKPASTPVVEEHLPEPQARTPTATEEKPAAAVSTDSGPSTFGEARTSYATPVVRKMAAERGVDLATVEGTGVGGRIRKQDIIEASSTAGLTTALSQEIAASQLSPLRGRTEKLSNLRKVIASRMIESLKTSAQLTSVVEVDLTRVDRLRKSAQDDFQAREGVRLTFTPFFAKAATDVLKTHPKLNASIDLERNEVMYHDSENLAIAVDTDRGLLTPVIKNAGDLSISGLTRKLADIAERTRDNKVTPDELSGGTFTLTNTGSRGALFDTPIINQPQVAILATGAVVKRAVVVDDPNLGETIAVRKMMYLALTYDHRLVDGADAARFLGDVKARLESASFDL